MWITECYHQLCDRAVKSPQTNGLVERLPRTILTEFYRITFRKKLYPTLAELQKDLDEWLRYYNEERGHQGRWCYGRTPRTTFIETIPLAKEKLLAAELIGHFYQPDNEDENHTLSDPVLTFTYDPQWEVATEVIPCEDA